MNELRENMLIVIQMKKSNDGWITRKEIALTLELPGRAWVGSHNAIARKLEREGLIESRMVGRLWEYRAK